MSETPADAAARMAKGEFEAVETLLEEALRADPGSTALRMAYFRSLAMQLQFDRAIEQALRLLRIPTLGSFEIITILERFACCATQVNDPAIVRPYLALLDDVSRAAYPSDRCWPPRILRQAGFLDEARAGFERILRDYPGDPFTTFILGETMMEQGDPAGLVPSLAFSSRAFMRAYQPSVQPIDKLWEDEPLDGRSLAVIAWGGHGDFFQFAGHAAQMKRLGVRHLTAVVAAPFDRLLLSAGFDEVVPKAGIDAVLARSDHWTSTFGLMRADLNGGLRKPSGYMAPPPSLIADDLAARMRAKAAGRPCIGLYWHSDQHLGEVKSVPLARLCPLLNRRDVHWVILQRGFGLRRLIEAGFDADVTIADDVLPFDDAGALMARLDGMVSICAWPFHLAGAIGTRVWLLAGRILSSRHLNSDGASHLYPHCATVVRQPTLGDWPGAIARMNGELDAFVAEFTASAAKAGPTARRC